MPDPDNDFTRRLNSGPRKYDLSDPKLRTLTPDDSNFRNYNNPRGIKGEQGPLETNTPLHEGGEGRTPEDTTSSVARGAGRGTAFVPNRPTAYGNSSSCGAFCDGDH